MSEKVSEETESYARLVSQSDDNEKIYDIGPDTLKELITIIKKAILQCQHVVVFSSNPHW